MLLVLLSCVGCRTLIKQLLKDDDEEAGAADATATVATAEPSATATASASATPSTTATVAAAPKIPKCASGESFVQLDTGDRACSSECIDPSCDCKQGVVVLATGKLSSAPGDRRAFCPKAKAAGKKAVPKCAAGLSLVAEFDEAPLFCAKPCSGDNDCKPAKCDDQAFGADEKTGIVFAGVGKSFPICGKGAGASPPASASAASSATTLSVPAGTPASIPNPKGLPCPPGFGNAGGVLSTCNKTCTVGGKCPAGSKCNDALLLCR